MPKRKPPNNDGSQKDIRSWFLTPKKAKRTVSSTSTCSANAAPTASAGAATVRRQLDMSSPRVVTVGTCSLAEQQRQQQQAFSDGPQIDQTFASTGKSPTVVATSEPAATTRTSPSPPPAPRPSLTAAKSMTSTAPAVPLARVVSVTPSKKPAPGLKASPTARRVLFPIFEKPATTKPKLKIDWEERRKNLIERFVDNKYLLQHHLGQLKREQDIMTSATTVEQQPTSAPTLEDEEGAEGQPEGRNIPISAQQRRIADHPPHIPLSVRAGAGTGKTRTMVTRAAKLVSLHGVDPERILMVTFTNKAAKEMRDRIRTAFSASRLEGVNDHCLPTVRTFHSLAFRWIRSFWKQCGLGRYPTLLATNAQQKKLMKEVIQSYVKQLQLERCYRFLGLALPDEYEASLETIISEMKQRCPELYEKARTNAEEGLSKSNKTKKGAKAKQPTGEPAIQEGSVKQGQPTAEKAATIKRKTTRTNPPKKKKTAKQVAAEERKVAELELLLQSEIQRQCYLELLRGKKKSEQPVACDLEGQWKCDTEQCNMYLELVEKARKGQHQPAEYLPKDAAIFQRYENMQEVTGKIDFDKMLDVFVKLIQNSEWVAAQFRQLYDYVIVDEYQDNSEVQSKMLLQIVTDGRVTVVGDDDQCIYEFRGASPGNFESFAKHYSSTFDSTSGPPTPVEEAVLEENYRSTGNILIVGAAFLEDSIKRSPKTLRPARESGEKVELWKCQTADEQARRIAESIRKRRDDEVGVSWGQIACLFRCFQMGQQGYLHFALQRQLGEMKIPFKVVGGKSLLTSEKNRDILAYLSLTLAGTQDRMDDDAFERVLNKPPRRIGMKTVELIKAHRNSTSTDVASKADNGVRHTPVGLEEAAKALISEETMLSDGQKVGLERFFSLLYELRAESMSKPLPDLVLSVWETTGLDEWHATKAKNQSQTESHEEEEPESEVHCDDEVEKEDNEGNKPIPPPQYEERSRKVLPQDVRTLVGLAESHVKERDKRERKTRMLASRDVKCVKSLATLAKECAMQHAKELPTLPQLCLPQTLLDELHMSGGIGLPVVSSFLADLALQMKETEEDQPNGEDDRVTISTIHRAKGLEWREVYVPFFNEGYMPTEFREDNTKGPSRHQLGCCARAGRRCNLNCVMFYAGNNARRLGLSPAERHSNEERRLAHVAATRAKDRLVFVSTESNNGRSCESSSFEACLARLPKSVLETKPWNPFDGMF